MTEAAIPLEPGVRRCPVCVGPLGPNAYWTRKYCSDLCRDEASRAKKAADYRTKRAELPPLLCAECGTVVQQDRSAGGRVSKWCVDCANDHSAAMVRMNNRSKNIRLHGLTMRRYAELIEKQNGRCGICASSEPGGKGSWHIDHDHKCCPGSHSCGNCVRGLLCARCNTGLGMLKDSPMALISAATYVIQYYAETNEIEEIDLIEWMIRGAA